MAEIRWTGPVDPDSILGQTLADRMRGEPSIQGLPGPFRDAVIREAIVAMHEPGESGAEQEPSPKGTPRERDQSGVELILQKFGRKEFLVVRDDDLKLLDAVCAGAQAAAGAGYFLIDSVAPSSTIAAITGIIVSTFKVLRQLARKSATVDPTRIQIILALKKGGAMSVTEIVDWLNNALKEGAAPCTEDRVLSQLKSLERVPLADGTVVPFVQETGDGKWIAAGI